MAFEISGTIKEIMDLQTFASGFTKREFVLTTQEQYPQQIKFEMVKEKADILGSMNAGDQVKVSFNVRGNEYQNRYYVNLQAWKIERMAESANPVIESGKKLTPLKETMEDYGETDDALPF